nr:hypothetical protein [Clostridia bacterium]
MFLDKIKGIFKKKDKSTVSETVEADWSAEFGLDADEVDGEITERTEIFAETNAVAIVDTDEKDKRRGKERRTALNEFSRLAEILNKDESEVIAECKLFQIRNIMSKLSKAVVRRGIADGKIKSLIKNVGVSGIYEIAVAPVYIGAFAANVKDQSVKVCAVVDFPFGESSFKVKLSEIKNCVKSGVDGVLTVINTASLLKEHQAELKKQLKKAGRIKGVEKGVAVNAEDISSDDIKRLFHILEKTNTDYAAFLFGKVSKRELASKMAEINAHKGGVKVKVMANVEDVAGVKALIALGADGIITPYADAVAKELFKDFGIKSVRLS